MDQKIWMDMSVIIILERETLNSYVFKAKVRNWYFLVAHLQKL